MASFSCHTFAVTKQVRLERIVRPPVLTLTPAVRMHSGFVTCAHALVLKLEDASDASTIGWLSSQSLWIPLTPRRVGEIATVDVNAAVESWQWIGN